MPARPKAVAQTDLYPRQFRCEPLGYWTPTALHMTRHNEVAYDELKRSADILVRSSMQKATGIDYSD